MKLVSLSGILVAACAIGAPGWTCGAGSELIASSRVPRWDSRGLGPLPRQGIACLDVSRDARRIAVGTIAPPGDPNVVLLDGDRRIMRTHMAGQRRIQDVALDGDGAAIHALCTMPAGRASDFCVVFRCDQDQEVKLATGSPGQEDQALNRFEYGDQSNRCGPALRSNALGGAALTGPSDFWWGADAAPAPWQLHSPRAHDAVTICFAAGPGGQAAVGCTGQIGPGISPD